MTEYEFASAVMNRVTSHEGVTQSSLTTRQIRDEADNLRLQIVQQLEKQRVLMPEAYYQHLEKIKTTRITEGVFKGWSYIKIPRIHTNMKHKPEIQYAGPTAERTPNRIVISNHHIYTPSDRFIGDAPTAFYDNDQIKFSEGYKEVTIKALFEDPSDLTDYQQYDWRKDPYPCPAGDLELIVDRLVRRYIPEVYRVPPQPNTQVDNPQIQQQSAANRQASNAG